MSNVKLDARNYRWKEWGYSIGNGPFDFLQTHKLPVAIKDVFFDEDTLDVTEYEKNGVSFGFYGSGSIHQHAAVLCEDGSILFCVVSGRRFKGTFASQDKICMKYYTLTRI